MQFTYNLSIINSGKRTLINPTAPTWFSMLHMLEFPSVDPSVIVYVCVVVVVVVVQVDAIISRRKKREAEKKSEQGT